MGLKRNFLFSSILTVSGYLFPILVYPHVARALGVHNMGVCNFVDSIIDYFILFSMLGISTVGIREIAAAHHDRDRLSSAFSSLLVLGGITTVIALVALVVSAYTIPALAEYRKLLLIGVVKLLGNFLMIDWFYRGLEDFRYVTMRTIAVKIGFVVAVFIWVWHPDDYITYYLLLCLMMGINAMFSCLHAASRVKFSIKGVDMRLYLKPFLIMGLYCMLNSMYTTFNVAYLGFSCGDTEVGYYTTATKFFMILIGLYTAFTTVMIPHMSTLAERGDMEEFRHMGRKAVNFLMAIGVPLVAFTCVFSAEIIALFSGDQYLPAALPARIVFPLILIIGYEQIIIIQMLLPLKKEKAMFVGSIIGATIGLSLNLLLVNRMESAGSAIAWVGAEVAVLISGQAFLTHYTGFRFPGAAFCRNIAAYLPLAAMLAGMYLYMPAGNFTRLLAGGTLTLVYAAAAQLLLLKNETVMELMSHLIPSLNRTGR